MPKFYRLVIFAACALAPFSAWSDSKRPLSRDSCEEGFVDPGPELKEYFLVHSDDHSFEIEKGCLVVFNLIHDDVHLPGMIKGEVTSVHQNGVFVNDVCFVRWGNINLDAISVFYTASPAGFDVIYSTLKEWIDVRSEILVEGHESPWKNPRFVYAYNEIRMMLKFQALIRPHELSDAVDLIIRVAGTPGGQHLVDLFERQFMITAPNGENRPWAEVFGRTDLAKNGLSKLELLRANFNQTSAKAQ